MERLTQKSINYCAEICRAQDCETYHGVRDDVCGDAAIYNRLAAYEDLEEQGRIMVLPCKVGDTIFILRGDVKNGYETVKKTHVEEVRFGLGCLNKQMELYPFYYLTREEAEAALKGVSEDA